MKREVLSKEESWEEEYNNKNPVCWHFCSLRISDSRITVKGTKILELYVQE